MDSDPWERTLDDPEDLTGSVVLHKHGSTSFNLKPQRREQLASDMKGSFVATDAEAISQVGQDSSPPLSPRDSSLKVETPSITLSFRLVIRILHLPCVARMTIHEHEARATS